MSTTITLRDATVPRDSFDYLSGTSWVPGHTVIVYVGGQYAGVQVAGPYSAVPYAGLSGDLQMPDSSRISIGAKTVTAKDSTDITQVATTAVTLT